MYPISYDADPALDGRNRLTSFFRYIVAIPWLIVADIYGFVAEIAAMIAWFAIVFTGKYPEGLYNFNAGYLRMIEPDVQLRCTCSTTSCRRSAATMLPDYPVRVGVRLRSTSTTASRPGCA